MHIEKEWELESYLSKPTSLSSPYMYPFPAFSPIVAVLSPPTL